ncbi:type II toxin-antitoxin system HicA family toxin [Marinobacterium stanieri]|uniref:type II toxin-antitoxin system HicA family toxin n=1 Tax=Marinobacterium stanieri TaxID=49186 RepID=UPI00192AA985
MPRTYNWNELETLLNGLGYETKQGSGSRVKFYHPEKDHLLSLHKPHPGNEMKAYAVKYVAQELKEQGHE